MCRSKVDARGQSLQRWVCGNKLIALNGRTASDVRGMCTFETNFQQQNTQQPKCYTTIDYAFSDTVTDIDMVVHHNLTESHGHAALEICFENIKYNNNA